MAVSTSFIIGIVVLAFMAFSIGLNLGMHGMFQPHEPTIVTTYTGGILDRQGSSSTFGPSVVQKEPQLEVEHPPTHVNPIGDNQGRQDPEPNPVPAVPRVFSVANPLPLRDLTSPTSSSSVLAEYVKSGQPIPIALLTCNRPELLDQTIQSILSVRGVDRNHIVVLQDGAFSPTSEVVLKHQLQLHQHTVGVHLQGGAGGDGATRIARHYKWSLSKVFELYPKAPGAIIIEDDLLFSPDFYDYFLYTIPILDVDPTVFIISAWNDNGFKGKVKDTYELRRTDFFPGLGWFLPRMLYQGELERKWPESHWDHWLRSAATHRNREIIHPQVPRTFHNGIKGTFMDLNTHNKYFRDIAYNTDTSVSWAAGTHTELQAVVTENYEKRIAVLASECTHLSAVYTLPTVTDVNPDPGFGTPPFEAIATYFGIWHEHRRGSHHGLHEFYWNNGDAYVLLFNVFEVQGSKNYKHLKPSSASILTPSMFKHAPSPVKEQQPLPDSVEAIPSKNIGANCNQVCQNVGKRCNADYFAHVNNCQRMQKDFGCSECADSYGLEQPAFVDARAEIRYLPSKCLITSQPSHSTCTASHPVTYRLCPCE